jgi:hypothetical protein
MFHMEKSAGASYDFEMLMAIDAHCGALNEPADRGNVTIV